MKVLIIGPVFSQSGYGTLARFVLNSLKQTNLDLYLAPTNWGMTGWINLPHKERIWYESLAHKHNSLMGNYGNIDLSLQITVPNEWKKIAQKNIGVTAGLETDKVPEEWTNNSNLMDRVLVTSTHSKDSLNWNSKITTPIDVFHIPYQLGETKEIDLDLKTDFNFLNVAQWAPRKNLESCIRWFVEEFFNDEVGLVVKTNQINACQIDKWQTKRRLTDLLKEYEGRKCKVYLLHGYLSDQELGGLYNNEKVKALVSTTHGEGYFLPAFDAAWNGLPVVATKWSSHLDFLMPEGKKLFAGVDFDLREVQQHHLMPNIILPGFRWAYVKEFDFKRKLRQVYKDYSRFDTNSNKLQSYLHENFNQEILENKFLNLLNLKKEEQKQNEVIVFE